MARRRKASLLEAIARFILLVFLLGSSSIVAFWNSLTQQYRTGFLIALTVVFFSGAVLIILVVLYRKKQREVAWKNAMAAWGQSQRDGRATDNQSARFFSPGHLEKFSAQLFKQMGYRVMHTGQSGDHGVDVRLINPKGQVELVQCKQWNKPVGEPEVRDLAGAMLHEKAVRGFIMAPGGFSVSARSWAKDKPIVLADEREINRLVQSAYGAKT